MASQPNQTTPASTDPTGAGLPKAYRPSDHEKVVTERWDAAKAFRAHPENVVSGQKPAYAIFIPPPNVTAALHLGHALNNTLQDVLARAHRMKGFETLWMPGTDHAGIATQAVVEKRVLKEEGKRRKDFTREAFVEKIQAFKDEYEATITAQLKEMGCSCDWDRQRFTMDPQCAAAVREAFFRLFRDGLIYRGKRLVNWDPALQTAVADDECYDAEIDGFFYYLRYPLVSWTPGSNADTAKPVTWGDLHQRGYPGASDHPATEQAWVTVATTRPETYLGDTAIGVSPQDPRAKSLEGLFVRLPLVGRIIPIIADDYVVLPAHLWKDQEAAKGDPKAQFATGFLKVTPAHDQNDYDLYQRHKGRIDQNSAANGLVNVMAPDGSISDKHGWSDIGDSQAFIGQTREAARKGVVAEFKAKGWLEGTKPYKHSVKHSDRSKAIVEPYLSDQWYVKVTDPRMAQAANAALVPAQRTTHQTPSASPPNLGGTGVPPVLSSPPSSSPLRATGNNLTITHRNLPHWERGGETYFVTFRVRSGTLSAAERKLALDACKHWDGKKAEVFAAVVMHDHVHLLISPWEISHGSGKWHSLSELLHSIKSFSAHEINSLRGTTGSVWQDESFDRMIRREDEFQEKVTYMCQNPVKAGLASHWDEYPFIFMPEETRCGRRRFSRDGVEEKDRDEGEHRRDACATEKTEVKTAATPGNGELEFFPARYAKTYEQWHDNIRDWCISRQLWWGHRIPVWTLPHDRLFYGDFLDKFTNWLKNDRVAIFNALYEDPSGSHIEPNSLRWICVRNTDDQEIITALESEGFTQDPDVLDTWFSSALWPLSTLGWPNPSAHNAQFNKNLLEAFNPSSVLCTAREIITLWVSRMVMFNRYFGTDSSNTNTSADTNANHGNGPIPFKDVFIHAMIQDGEGRKMSKSLGNGVDPRDIIASHGADAMRFTLVQMTTQTQDVRMPVEVDKATGKNTSAKFDLGRNYCNKLWNTTRFVLEKLGKASAAPSPAQALTARDLSLLDRWMLSRLAATVKAVDRAIENYEFSDYAEAMYKLLWWDLCDWYLEGVKPTVEQSAAQRAVLAHALETIVRLLHPIAPFITESIWEHLRTVQTAPIAGITLEPSRVGGLLCTAGWPRIAESWIDADAESRFESVRELIDTIRNLRSQHQVLPKRRVTLHIHSGGAVAKAQHAFPGLLETLCGIEKIETAAPTGVAVAFRALGEELHLANLADAVDAGTERDRLTKLIADLEKTESTMEKRLGNEGYIAKAPPKLVEESKAQLAKVKEELAASKAKLATL